jgi:hypothetical protein
MRHFAEFIVFNGFNSIWFRAAVAKAAVARADEKPGPRRRRFLKNNTPRQRLWQEIVGFLSRAPPAGPRKVSGAHSRSVDTAWRIQLEPEREQRSLCEGQITRAPRSKLN